MRSLFICFFILCTSGVLAQEPYQLRIIASDKDSSFLTKNFSYQKTFRDTISRATELKALMRKLYQQGYLEATCTQITYDGALQIGTLFTGYQWQWAQLGNGNLDEVLLERIRYKEKLYNDKPFRPSEVSQLLDDVLIYYENNGYPFASVRLDSLQVNQERQLEAKIFVNRNQLITIDSITVKGNARISNKYLANYLGFRLPEIYDESKVRNINMRLKELPFVTEERPSQLQFSGTTATALLYLKKRNASNFDFILGVLPNSNTSGKLLVTGEGRLKLLNAFGRGESLDFRFSQLPGKTTEVNLNGNYPYLFNLPFGAGIGFELYKDDTLDLRVSERISLQYLFTGVNKMEFFFRNTTGSALSIDTAAIISSKMLPATLDYNTQTYGIAFQFEALDYRINPQSGIALQFKGEGGNRTVRENAKITSLQDPEQPDFSFSSLYDSVNENKTQFRMEAVLDKYWSVAPRSSFKTSYYGGMLISKVLYSNERFRIGGFRLLRGFDDNSLYNTQYHVLSAEYHYYLSRNSFFYLFFDGAYISDETLQPATSDTPYGFGAGFNFETKGGIFGLSYALGHQQNNPIEFRAAKIHFGYVNYF